MGMSGLPDMCILSPWLLVYISSKPLVLGDDVQLETSVTHSFYNSSAYADERSPLLICTPTHSYIKKSSVLFVNKAAIYKFQQLRGSGYALVFTDQCINSLCA